MLKTIYTANFNGYDSFKEPKVVTSGWKYVYFTDDTKAKSSVWNVIHVPNPTQKEARRIKIVNPYRQQDVSIWVDASMEVNCNLDEFVERHSRRDFSLLKHPNRDCVYEEARACIKRKKDDPLVIEQQMELYRESGYPASNGLVATGVLIRRRSDEVSHFCDLWWREVERHSRRDQLSFNYVNYLFPIDYHLIPFEVLQTDFLLCKHNQRQ